MSRTSLITAWRRSGPSFWIENGYMEHRPGRVSPNGRSYLEACYSVYAARHPVFRGIKEMRTLVANMVGIVDRTVVR